MYFDYELTFTDMQVLSENKCKYFFVKTTIHIDC